jgi:hypothetical protein
MRPLSGNSRAQQKIGITNTTIQQYLQMTFYFKSTMNENICPSGTSPRRLGALVAVLFVYRLRPWMLSAVTRWLNISVCLGIELFSPSVLVEGCTGGGVTIVLRPCDSETRKLPRRWPRRLL